MSLSALNSGRCRHLWFDEGGEPKSQNLQQVLLPAEKTLIKQKSANIGTQDVLEVTGSDGSMMEPLNARLDKIEIQLQLLGDLLEVLC